MFSIGFILFAIQNCYGALVELDWSVSGGDLGKTIISVHDTVKWNMDGVAHTVTFPNWYDSGNIPANGMWEHVFLTPGTYSYACAYHSSMRGTIEVQPDPTTTTTPTANDVCPAQSTFDCSKFADPDPTNGLCCNVQQTLEIYPNRCFAECNGADLAMCGNCCVNMTPIPSGYQCDANAVCREVGNSAPDGYCYSNPDTDCTITPMCDPSNVDSCRFRADNLRCTSYTGNNDVECGKCVEQPSTTDTPKYDTTDTKTADTTSSNGYSTTDTVTDTTEMNRYSTTDTKTVDTTQSKGYSTTVTRLDSTSTKGPDTTDTTQMKGYSTTDTPKNTETTDTKGYSTSRQDITDTESTGGENKSTESGTTESSETANTGSSGDTTLGTEVVVTDSVNESSTTDVTPTQKSGVHQIGVMVVIVSVLGILGWM